MYRATRDFINARQPHTRYVLEVVRVAQLHSMPANACLANATQDSLLARGNKVVSGWIVDRFDSGTQSTEITQHWWNIDMNGKYFDVTTGVRPHMEYVVDSDISEYGQAMYHSVVDLVAMSLLYKQGGFWGVKQHDGALVHVPLSSLSNEQLFKLNFNAGSDQS
jgi:hypothetical protein